MKPQDVALIPPIFITEKDERFKCEGRLWQSAPSAALTEKGRIFCVLSADNIGGDELPTNYTACGYSDDGGATFKLAFYAYHEEKVRISETLLFSHNGKLYHFWTQSYRYFDGRGGIWSSVCNNPDSEKPVFESPKRLCDGFMAHNPTLLKSGDLLFPASVWTHMETEFHPLPDYEKVSLWKCDNNLENFKYLGGVKAPVPDYTENTVFETENGLTMLFRTEEYAGGINVSYSGDGTNWTEPKPFVLSGPSSRFMVGRMPSGALLIVNHHNFKGRNNLTALLSYDNGETFPYSLLLDERNVSYPSGNITKDGRVILAYDRGRTSDREIIISSFTEDDIKNGSFGSGSFNKKVVVTGGSKGDF